MAGGRPRAFDVEQALDKALSVFWAKGYEGASLPDLTEAMGINRPSLYAAFGNKEELFRKALDRYGQRMGCVNEALSGPVARDAVEQLLHAMIAKQTACIGPKGCMMMQATFSTGDAGAGLREDLARRRETMHLALRDRFERARREGELPDSANAADLARFYAGFMNGLAVQAAGGSTGEELDRLVPLAMRAWPAG